MLISHLDGLVMTSFVRKGDNEMNKKLLPVENLRCLRDPNCESHRYHAGHITRIGPIDPRRLHEAHMRRRRAGRRASRLVGEMENSTWGPRILLTSSQRHTLIEAIILELLDTIYSPITS